ncbi:MAG TPA: MFS transporter [Candidatus Nanopelagicaceae bacterium]|nr:MFS transporter [Candidatus Nanopelagicaceae bacterium]
MHRILSPYQQLFTTPGALAFSMSGFISRMPMAISPLAIVLLAYSRTHSYGISGAVTATYAITAAFSGPRWARLADRKGQYFAITRGLPMHVVGLLLIVILISTGTPRYTWFLAAIVAALFWVQTGSLVRRRWHHVLSDRRQLVHSAWSFESLLDEIVYIVGPVLATLLCTQVAPSAGLLASIAFVSCGALLLASQSATEPPVNTAEEQASRTRVMRIPIVNSITVVYFLMGGFFGAVEIITVAFCTERGHRALSGAMLAIWAFASALAAVANGAVSLRTPHAKRFILFLTGLTVLSIGFIFASTLLELAAVLFITGFAIAPILIAGLTVVENEVPDSQITEGIALATMGFPIGSAVAASVSGRVLDLTSAHQAFIVAWLFIALALASIAPRYRTWRRLLAGS